MKKTEKSFWVVILTAATLTGCGSMGNIYNVGSTVGAVTGVGSTIGSIAGASGTVGSVLRTAGAVGSVIGVASTVGRAVSTSPSSGNAGTTAASNPTGNTSTSSTTRNTGSSSATSSTSTTKARLIATVNEADDDQHFGFEWLRYNAPDDMPPNKVSAPLYDGRIIGSLGGLNPDIYYKYRAFYKSDAGEMVYGEWIPFLTGDANVFFEPETHTKEADRVTATGAQLSGVWIEGTEDIQEKGFEYWTVSGSKTRAVGSDAQKVVVSGQATATTLEGLKAGATYGFRSYVKTTSGKTTYGEEKTFKTILLGDVDGDGELTKADADAIAKHIIGQTPTGFNLKMADVNVDGYVNVVDIVCLTNMIE